MKGRSGGVKRSGAKDRKRKAQKRKAQGKIYQTKPEQVGILRGLMTYQKHSIEQFLSRAYHIIHGWEKGNNFLDVFLNSVNDITAKQ